MNKMKEIRARERVTQFVLATKTSISQSRLSYFENGWLIPKREEKERIAKALGLRPDEVFPESEE